VLNPRHLRAFLTVTQEGSVIRSSQVLRRAQSAITHAIKELEKDAGGALFERHPHGMMPTDIGKTLLMRVERAFAEMNAAHTAFAADLADDAWARNAPIFSLSISRQRLLAFVELAEQHNMAAVAETLGISQPAVSQSLREIENGIRIDLFKRTPRGIVPTPLGAVLALHIKRALAELRIAEDEINALKGAVQGSIAVGSLSVGRARLLPLAITRLLKDYPNLTVTTEEGAFEHLAMLLRAGEIDFILGALRSPEQTTGLIREVITHDTMAIVVRAGHPLAKRRKLSLADVLALDWVLPKRPTPTRELLEATLHQRGLASPTVKLETADLAVTLGAVLQSDMVTAVSEHQLNRELQSDALSVLPIALPETTRPIGILQRAGGIPSPATRLLLDIIREIGKGET
jgi:LysR family transcriptional regulator, regulator for genes of the gallate degradation pathway